MKKLITGILILVLVILLVGCGDIPASAPDEILEPASSTPEPIEEVEPEPAGISLDEVIVMSQRNEIKELVIDEGMLLITTVNGTELVAIIGYLNYTDLQELGLNFEGIDYPIETGSELAKEEPATFTISNLVIFPTEVGKGERIAISVLVTNNSNCAGNYEVVFKMGGVLREVVDVSLAGGDVKEVELALDVWGYTAGTHSVDVNGLRGTFAIKEQGPIPFENNFYTIRVTGNPLTETETEFSGSYMEITKDGQCSSRSVDGITPREYLVYGTVISCCFQNQNDFGLLRVEILYKGTVINSSSTIADYGVVTVSN